MRLWAIVIAALAAILVAIPVMAGRIDYTIGLDAPAVDGGSVSFTVTRSAPYDGTEWVSLTCDGGVRLHPTSGISAKADYPVIWGTPESLVGYVAFDAVYGSECTAVLTESPWRYKHNDIRLTFPVN